MFVPLALTFWYSLHRYSGFGRMRFIGLDNYRTIVQRPDVLDRRCSTPSVYTAHHRADRHRARPVGRAAAQPRDARARAVPGAGLRARRHLRGRRRHHLPAALRPDHRHPQPAARPASASPPSTGRATAPRRSSRSSSSARGRASASAWSSISLACRASRGELYEAGAVDGAVGLAPLLAHHLAPAAPDHLLPRRLLDHRQLPGLRRGLRPHPRRPGHVDDLPRPVRLRPGLQPATPGVCRGHRRHHLRRSSCSSPCSSGGFSERRDDA